MKNILFIFILVFSSCSTEIKNSSNKAEVNFIIGKVLKSQKVFSEAAKWNRTRINDNVNKQFIRTRLNSLCRVNQSGYIIKIAPNAIVSFKKNEFGKSEVNLKFGKVFVKTLKNRKHNGLVVHSPTLTTGTRGTEFSVEVSHNAIRGFITIVKVKSGSVLVHRNIEFSGKVKSIILPAGKKIKVDARENYFLEKKLKKSNTPAKFLEIASKKMIVRDYNDFKQMNRLVPDKISVDTELKKHLPTSPFTMAEKNIDKILKQEKKRRSYQPIRTRKSRGRGDMEDLIEQ